MYIVDVSFDNDQVVCNHHCQDVHRVPVEKDTHTQSMKNMCITTNMYLNNAFKSEFFCVAVIVLTHFS